MQDLPVDKLLGPFPLIQLAVAILIFGGFALAIYRGWRDRKNIASYPHESKEQRWFFDGPLNAALNTLRDIRNSQERVIENTTPIAEELRKQTSLLEDIKDALKDHHGRR